MINRGILEYRRQHRQGVLLLSAAALRTISQPWTLVPHKKIGFSATVQTWFCQRLLLSRAQGDGTTMYRTRDHLGDGYDQFVLMVLLHEGGLTCTQGGRTTTAGRGDIVTLLPRDTYESNAIDGTDATMLYVPIDYLESRGLSPEGLAAASWPGGPLLAGIQALVESTLDLAEADTAGQSPHIEQALLELLVGLLRRYLGGLEEEDSAANQLRSRVLGMIAEKYANPGYGADAIAAELGVSRRFVYKLFEGRGVSVASLLRSQRLDEAESLLRSLGREATLSRIARATGFASADSFSRAFKENRGMSPSVFRARHPA